MSASSGPTLGAFWLRLLIEALTGAGFDAAKYCQRRGWDPDRLEETRSRLPWRDLVDIWSEAARTTGDPLLGLHAAMSLSFRAQGPFGYLIMSSPTLLDGLSMAMRYQELHFDGRALALEERGADFALVLSLPDSPPAVSHQIEYLCTVLKRTCEWVAGPAFKPLRVRFRHAGPSGAAEHERAFECPVEFRQAETALIMERRMLDLPSLYANAEVLETVLAIAERRLAELRSHPWTVRVRTALQGRLGTPVDQLAGELGVSRRSLQRKLAAEGTAFARMLDDARRERALALVRREGLPLTAVASELGFADPRAFARAFRRWTGLTPSSFRTGSVADRVETAEGPVSSDPHP